MKTKKLTRIACISILIHVALFFNNASAQTTPTILIDGESVMANSISITPYWLNSTQTIAVGNLTKFISVIQFNIVPAQGGGKELKLDSIIKVTTQQSVPLGKTWKVESVALDPTAVLSQSGDNWGSQVAQTGAELNGNGSGSSPLGLAQQGASIGQSLIWNGTTWQPANPVSTDATLSGGGTPASPLSIAQNGASTSQVLTWNGSQWVPASPTGGTEFQIFSGVSGCVSGKTSLTWADVYPTAASSSYDINNCIALRPYSSSSSLGWIHTNNNSSSCSTSNLPNYPFPSTGSTWSSTFASQYQSGYTYWYLRPSNIICFK